MDPTADAVERIATDAICHLQRARREMNKLVSVSRDEISRVVLNASFEELESDCKEFLFCRGFRGQRSGRGAEIGIIKIRK